MISSHDFIEACVGSAVSALSDIRLLAPHHGFLDDVLSDRTAITSDDGGDSDAPNMERIARELMTKAHCVLYSEQDSEIALLDTERVEFSVSTENRPLHRYDDSLMFSDNMIVIVDGYITWPEISVDNSRMTMHAESPDDDWMRHVAFLFHCEYRGDGAVSPDIDAIDRLARRIARTLSDFFSTPVYLDYRMRRDWSDWPDRMGNDAMIALMRERIDLLDRYVRDSDQRSAISYSGGDPQSLPYRVEYLREMRRAVEVLGPDNDDVYDIFDTMTAVFRHVSDDPRRMAALDAVADMRREFMGSDIIPESHHRHPSFLSNVIGYAGRLSLGDIGERIDAMREDRSSGLRDMIYESARTGTPIDRLRLMEDRHIRSAVPILAALPDAPCRLECRKMTSDNIILYDDVDLRRLLMGFLMDIERFLFSDDGIGGAGRQARTARNRIAEYMDGMPARGRGYVIFCSDRTSGLLPGGLLNTVYPSSNIDDDRVYFMSMRAFHVRFGGITAVMSDGCLRLETDVGLELKYPGSIHVVRLTGDVRGKPLPADTDAERSPDRSRVRKLADRLVEWMRPAR